jgi:hypothetical protein
MIQVNKKKAVKKLSLIQKVQLGFIGLAAGIAATFTSVKAPETNLASSINLSQQPQQSIVEEKEVIEKETTTKTPEFKNGFDNVQQTQPLKTSSNTNGNIKVEIDKKLISKSNTTKPIQEVKKFKSILPSIGIGEVANASGNYQRRNGVAGEFKYLKVRSYDYNYSIEGRMEASPEGTSVKYIGINAKAPRWYSPTPNGWSIPFRTSYTWRNIASFTNYFIGSNKRFYHFEYSSNYGSLLAYDNDVLIGNTIETYEQSPKGWGFGVRIQDLGGLVNMGYIGKNSCKIWDDGQFK